MTAKGKILSSEVVKSAGRQLELLGFRRTKGDYVFDITDETVGWVAFNTVSRRGDGRVGINPIVGVRHKQLDCLLQRLTAAGERGIGGTLSTSLGYVTPERRYLEWVFAPEPFDYEDECLRMIRAIEIYGIPFMTSNCGFEIILENIENLRFVTKDTAVYMLPAAYLLAGRRDSATAYVQNELKELGERSDLSARQYRLFASNLISEASSERQYRG